MNGLNAPPGNPLQSFRPCALGPIIDAVWPALLNCREHLRSNPRRDPRDWFFRWSTPPDPWSFELCGDRPDQNPENGVAVTFGNHQPSVPSAEYPDFSFSCGNLRRLSQNPEREPCLGVFDLYLPFLTALRKSMETGRVAVTAHLAQTLDGRIATVNGHSQWISNRANRSHAHRLRALHDAVMVGANTLRADNPRLTVRDVSGHNPVRVILTQQAETAFADYECPRQPGETWILGNGQDPFATESASNRHLRFIPVDHPHRKSKPGPNGSLEPGAVLASLARNGIHSVFVEGGGITISSFVNAALVDRLHLHLAPVILGSGVPAFSLPAVDTIDQGIFWRMRHFELDGEILLDLWQSSSVGAPPQLPSEGL